MATGGTSPSAAVPCPPLSSAVHLVCLVTSSAPASPNHLPPASRRWHPESPVFLHSRFSYLVGLAGKRHRFRSKLD